MPASLEKYRFAAALRPFSLVVALVACGLGAALALAEGWPVSADLVWVMLAGLLLQAGVNLINDRADLRVLRPEAQREEVRRACVAIERYSRQGFACLLLASLIGLYLLRTGGWSLLVLLIIGTLGALGYTQEPINYKRRGLGVLLVFWLMGVLMVSGTYLALTGHWVWSVFWHALPVSCLVSALLLSNELRDYEQDHQEGVATLAVRFGYPLARRLYVLLIGLAFVGAALQFLIGGLSGGFWLLGVVLVPRLLRLSTAAPGARLELTPWTGRLLALFGAGYILSLFV